MILIVLMQFTLFIFTKIFVKNKLQRGFLLTKVIIIFFTDSFLKLKNDFGAIPSLFEFSVLNIFNTVNSFYIVYTVPAISQMSALLLQWTLCWSSILIILFFLSFSVWRRRGGEVKKMLLQKRRGGDCRRWTKRRRMMILNLE